MVSTTSLAVIQGTNGTATPNGIFKSNAESPATPASTSAVVKPEKAAKPAPRLSIETTAEQLSTALGEKWEDYGRELNLFIVGKRTRSELQETLDSVLTDAMLKKLHNNLLMGILANTSRDPPPVNGSFSGWNRNKKRKEPMTGRGKSSGKQKRLKMEIMGLGPQERNRIKSFKALAELDAVLSLATKADFRARRSCIHLFRELFWDQDGQSLRQDFRRRSIFKLRMRLYRKLSRDTMFPWHRIH
jgi:Transcriptional regulator of RNA polII, SAGA, subunit